MYHVITRQQSHRLRGGSHAGKHPHAIDPPDHARIGRRDGRDAGARRTNASIGPPPHEKGPVVWMNMDQIELDAAYDQNFYAPAGAIDPQAATPPTADAMRARARPAAARKPTARPRSRSSTSTATKKAPNAPIFVFIHGGAWLGGEVKHRRRSGGDVHQRRRELRRARFRADQGSRRRSPHDGRSGPARHRLGLQERQGLRRRRQPHSISAAIRPAGICAASRW